MPPGAVLPQSQLHAAIISVAFTYSGTPAREVGSAPDVTSSVWRMRQQCAWWHLLCYSFRYVVPQFHLPTINSIYVIINLLGQPGSETLYILKWIFCCLRWVYGALSGK